MKVQDRLVLLGGFGACQELLDEVAEVALRMGVAALDATVFTFCYGANNPDKVARAIKGAAVVKTHSAGLTAVPLDAWDWVSDLAPQEKPALTAYNGPEVRSAAQLLSRGAVEGGRLVLRIAHDRSWREGRETFDGARKTFGSDIRHLGTISRFSTAGRLNSYRAATGIRVDAVVMERDLIFPKDITPYEQAAVPVMEQEGDHNELLIHPETVLGLWLDQKRIGYGDSQALAA
jgi:hypothetical protein